MPAPPLFTRLWSDLGTRTIIAERDGLVDLDLKSDWHCEARAPGGESAAGVLLASEGDDPRRIYDRILRFFGTDDPGSLWFAPRALPAAADRVPPHIEVGIWDTTGLPRPDADFVFVGPQLGSYAIVAEVKSSTSSFIQTPDAEGRPAFAVLRSDDLLVFEPVVGPDGQQLVPRIFSKPGHHTAFWAFARDGVHDAAEAIAEKLVSVASGEDLQSEEDTIAAGHALLRYRAFWAAEPLVSRRLGKISSLDASLTKWLIGYEKGDGGAFVELPKLLERFRSEKPTFAETFRLFYSRLRPAVRRANVSEPDRKRLEDAERVVDRLAASSFLDGEHLLFRGLSPFAPDPNATATDAQAQKKTSRSRSRDRSGPSRRR